MSIPLFDCHCDTAVRARLTGRGLRDNSLHLDLMRLKKFSPAAQVFAVCTETLDEPQEKASAVIRYFKEQIEMNSDIVKLCLNSHDIISATGGGKIAVLLSVEGAEQIGDIEMAYALGVRIVHITWNLDNELCGSAMGSGAGLSENGRTFVKKAQKLGIMLDMSHISEQGFWDVLEVSRKPVIAGHSNAKALCPAQRNLSDEQFVALKNQGGGAGINLYPDFLGLGRDIDAVFAHIEHFMALGGEKAVFLGCDLDGIDEMPKGIHGVQDLGKIYEVLLRHNYPESLVRDIFFNNIMNIMEKVM
ncbi:MAG: dipeptidase [Oscillospiraceae bacterium]